MLHPSQEEGRSAYLCSRTVSNFRGVSGLELILASSPRNLRIDQVTLCQAIEFVSRYSRRGVVSIASPAPLAPIASSFWPPSALLHRNTGAPKKQSPQW
jgi:hypothetical protein